MLSQQVTSSEGTPRIVAANLRFGFAQVPRPILRAKNLSPKAKLVYSLLLDYAWFEDYVFPSQETMAKELDISINTVQRALDELRAYRLIDWKQQGQNLPNVYSFLPIEESALQNELSCGNPKMGYPETPHWGTNDTNINNTNTKGGYPSNVRRADREESDYVNSAATTACTDIHMPPADDRGGAPLHEPVPTSGSTDTAAEAEDHQSRTIHRNFEIIEPKKYMPPPAEAHSIQSVHVPHAARTASEETAIQSAIQGYIRDAACKLHDEAPLKSSTTRAYNLYVRSGIQLNSFFDLLYDAEQETMRRSATIKKLTAQGFKNRMAYFFAIVEDKLGLRQNHLLHTPQSL
jgi:hypothetical protein